MKDVMAHEPTYITANMECVVVSIVSTLYLPLRPHSAPQHLHARLSLPPSTLTLFRHTASALANPVAKPSLTAAAAAIAEQPAQAAAVRGATSVVLRRHPAAVQRRPLRRVPPLAGRLRRGSGRAAVLRRQIWRLPLGPDQQGQRGPLGGRPGGGLCCCWCGRAR